MEKDMKFLDKDTDLHCRRVEALISGYIEANPEAFSLKEELITAARIHDIGKNQIPDEILNAPRRLTPEEREIINNHSYYSYLMAKEAGYSETVCQLVLLHHGDDKPHCDEVSVTSEVKRHADFLKVVDTYDEIFNVKKHADFLRIIDAYDALINPRVYKEGRTEESVLEIMKESPDEFPPDMVDMLFKWDGRIAIEESFRSQSQFQDKFAPKPCVLDQAKMCLNIPSIGLKCGNRQCEKEATKEFAEIKENTDVERE